MPAGQRSCRRSSSTRWSGRGTAGRYHGQHLPRETHLPRASGVLPFLRDGAQSQARALQPFGFYLEAHHVCSWLPPGLVFGGHTWCTQETMWGARTETQVSGMQSIMGCWEGKPLPRAVTLSWPCLLGRDRHVGHNETAQYV